MKTKYENNLSKWHESVSLFIYKTFAIIDK